MDPFDDGKLASQNYTLILVPKVVNDQDLSIEIINEIAEKSKENSLTYRMYTDSVKKQLGCKFVGESHWVLMRNKLVYGLGSYEKNRSLLKSKSVAISRIIDAIVLNFLYYVHHKKYLYSCAFCREEIDSGQH